MMRSPRTACARITLGALLVSIALLAATGIASADKSYVAPGDPILDGWTPNGTLVGSSIIDPDFGIDAYEIDDPTTGAGSVLYFDGGGTEVPAPGEPWSIRARLRVVDLVDDPDQSIFLEVTTNASQRFVLYFGSQTSPSQRTLVRLLDSTTTYLEYPQQPVVSGRTDYLTVELSSDGTEADFFVNGRQFFDLLPIVGFNQPSVPGRVLWGSGASSTTGHARFVEVHYVLGPAECQNGLDDDGDGLLDALDPDCASTLDPSEQGPVIPCDNGVDTDADGICDEDEGLYLLSASIPDFDFDGSLDGAEITAGTDPKDSDSDDDGIPDGIEASLGTDPLEADSDSDGLLDGSEIAVTRVFVTPASFDGNLGGLAGGDAVCEAEAGTQGVARSEVARVWLSQDAVEDARDRIAAGPYVRASGGETIALDLADLTDGALVNALNPSPSVFLWTGTTQAGLAEGADCSGWTTTASVASGGVSSSRLASWTDSGPHFSCGSLRGLACFARDAKLGTDPLDEDSDQDGLLDGAEVATYSTDPAAPDTDLDGFDDGIEVAAGTDPLDELDFPAPPVPLAGGLARGVLILALGLAVFGARRTRRS